MKDEPSSIIALLLVPIFLPLLIPLVLFAVVKKAIYETKKMRRWEEDEA